MHMGSGGVVRILKSIFCLHNCYQINAVTSSSNLRNMYPFLQLLIFHACPLCEQEIPLRRSFHNISLISLTPSASIAGIEQIRGIYLFIVFVLIKTKSFFKTLKTFWLSELRFYSLHSVGICYLSIILVTGRLTNLIGSID